jgi:hypothetical protein
VGRGSVQAAGLVWRARLVVPASGFGLTVAGTALAFDFLDRARGVSFSVLGAMIVGRQPANRIGWIFLLIGMLTPLQSLMILYDERSVIVGGLPGARWAVWASNWATFPVFPTGFALFAFLLFPNGRLPSRRWRPLARLAVAGTVVGAVLSALHAGDIAQGSGLPPLQNPLGVAALGGAANVASTAVWLGGTVLITIVIGGLLVRGRRASSLQERQQIKLLAYAVAVTIGLLLALTVLSLAHVAFGNSLWDLPIMLGFGIAVPIACGLAILRYRLYEIDRLISRTLSYALLTGLMAGVFAGLVLLTTRVLPFSSPVGVAASTLAAAGLFSPLRARLQRLVDRRFNRARYDAEATAAAVRSLEPAHVTVWMRP